ncbi:Haem-binding domain-containing protein [Chitinophaga ginsengisegetis]|uniref:Haem-binding domain-containing protein n=1 Tax=Chitinophaga ginsengisegetis TaxID=393003 RepID=A0A1T5NB29_9BACT|nr:heme-binding domain-containing protein [Chitinophaga ginsengisegetis]SKC97656.1 Haem-binding domain-containing protein [Chitinophaga ginsengisegetis]
MKNKKIILWIVLLIAVLIQFFRPARNISSSAQPYDITTAYNTSAEVKNILSRACNDCHSNNTVYPWYAEIQPVAWWMNKHVKDGKHDLNFNEFTNNPISRQYKKLGESAEMVNEGEMPLSSYTIIHANARLTAPEKKLLIDWCEGIRSKMKEKYPADSFVVKKRKA